MARIAPLTGMTACTLYDDAFEPLLLSDSDSDAVSVDELETVAAASPESTATRGCATRGAEGAGLDGVDTSCGVSVGLLQSEAFVPAEPDSGAPTSELPSTPPTPSTSCGDFGAPERITGLDFAEGAYGPALSPDGLTLYFSAYVSGDQQVYSAKRSDRQAGFADVTELSAVSSNRLDGAPFLTDDGRRLYFFSDRQGGVGGRDIWFSERRGEGFEAPELVPGINSRQSDLLPWLSVDELTLLFISSREGGRGMTDVWSVTRINADDAFGEPVNLAELSSNQTEGRVVLSADGLTAYFSSDREGGRGGQDLWTSSRERVEQPFSPPENLRALNSSDNEQDVILSSDETELLFASTRRGRQSELWRAVRSCP